MLSLPYAGTRSCGPKVFLLLRALASPSTSAVVCACMEQGPWCGSLLSYPLLVATLCFNPAEGPQTASGSAECRPAELPYVYWRWIYMYAWRATERRLHFDSPTRARVNSDSSVNDGYCFRLFSVDTSPSTYFSPFPSRTLPRSTRTMTASDSGQLRSSISLLGNHADFFTFAKHVSFEHSTGIPCPVNSSRRDGNINKRTKLKSFLPLDRRSVSPHRPACVRALRGQWAIWLAPRLSLATESTGTVLIPSQMSEIAGHEYET